MSSYERCPGCLEDTMDADTHECSHCGGSMVFQPKTAPAPVTVSDEMVDVALCARWGAMASIGDVLTDRVTVTAARKMMHKALEAYESARGNKP